MGRRSAFILLLLIYSVFTFADAFAPTAGWLIGLRFFAGIGIGAEIVVVDTYVTEVVPSYARGRYVAITQVVGFCAVPVAAVLARVLVPTHFWMSGWRWVMVIGASGALLTWWFRRRLPESPRWLESQGTMAEADAMMTVGEGAFSSKERSGKWRVTSDERRKRKNLHRGHGGGEHREHGEGRRGGLDEQKVEGGGTEDRLNLSHHRKDRFGNCGRGLIFADGDAGDFSGVADDRVLWICELGADVFVEDGEFRCCTRWSTQC